MVTKKENGTLEMEILAVYLRTDIAKRRKHILPIDIKKSFLSFDKTFQTHIILSMEKETFSANIVTMSL